MNDESASTQHSKIAAAMAAHAAALTAAAAGNVDSPFGIGVMPPPIAMSYFHVLTVADAAQCLRVSKETLLTEANAGRSRFEV